MTKKTWIKNNMCLKNTLTDCFKHKITLRIFISQKINSSVHA